MNGGERQAPLKVLIVDDHDVLHWGFKMMFSEVRWVQTCLAARTGQEAEAATRRHKPDVAVVNLDSSGRTVQGYSLNGTTLRSRSWLA